MVCAVVLSTVQVLGSGVGNSRDAPVLITERWTAWTFGHAPAARRGLGSLPCFVVHDAYRAGHGAIRCDG